LFSLSRRHWPLSPKAAPTTTNAVITALSAFGVTHLDIPFTSAKV
jgi:hypothetical protein